MTISIPEIDRKRTNYKKVTSNVPVEFPMSTIAFYPAFTLAAGSVVAGMMYVVSIDLLTSHPPELKWSSLFHDRKRQSILSLLGFIAAINGSIAYPANATKESVWLSNITTIITFSLVQWSLVIINHNTLVRFNTWLQGGEWKYYSQRAFHIFCSILYFLPFITMIPVYLSVADRYPYGVLWNSSLWNRDVYKPITLATIIGTQVFCTITDFILMRSIFAVTQETSSAMNSTTTAPKKRFSKNLLANYTIAWFFLVVDMVVKILIIAGYPILFDSIVSLFTCLLRARCNILFGLNMREVLSGGSKSGSSAANSVVSSASMTKAK